MDLAIIDQSKPGVPAEQIDLVEKVLDYAGEYMKLPADTEMSVTFVNNDEIQRYNREYRGLDKPTDVISFAIDVGWRDGRGFGEEHWWHYRFCR